MAEKPVKTYNRFRWIVYALMFIALVVVLIFGYWYFFRRNLVTTNDARIEADTVDLSSQVPGKLVSLFVAEGDTISRGRLLFELDKTMFEASLDKAENDYATAQKSLSISEEQYQKSLNGPRPEEIQIAQSALESATEQRDLAEKEWKRADQLYKENSITQSQWEQAQSVYDLSQYNFNSARENLRLIQAGSRPEDREIARRNVELSKAQIESMQSVVRQAQINLGYASVASPFDGIVVRTWREPGSVLTQGTPVVTAFNLGSLYVSANIPETNLHQIRLGNAVAITIDAYPGVRLTGYIDQILQAANSEFSLIPSEGVSGTFIKVTQRVQLVIQFEDYTQIQSLRLGPGLSVEVHIDIVRTINRESRSGPGTD